MRPAVFQSSLGSDLGFIDTIDAETNVMRRIASHAASAPAQIAITDSTSQLTYAELERRSNHLAAYLVEAGAQPEMCVGLLLDRSSDFIVAALAVLKSGAAYLPLDPSTPADRMAFILADAGVPMLLTHRGLSRKLPDTDCRVIELSSAEAAQIAGSPARLAAPAPQSLAYIIYTSGSTGKPKGVEITHANLSNLVDWHQSAFGVSELDRASQVAGLGFDAAAWEIWPHLAAGASVHMPDESTRRSAHALRDWLVDQAITISFVPTVLAEQLLHTSWPERTALRFLLTGADTLHRRPVAGLPFTLVNNYGPTECTVVATSGTVDPDGGGDTQQPSIGRPISNTFALILDDSLRPVPCGEPGELCLAGAHVGRGYRNLPELTAQRFVNYTSPAGATMRIYRTGDRARLLGNGEIAFLGRVDDQVKLRGYRVELGEIVACLDRHPQVEASTVVVRNDGGGPELLAYIMPRSHGRVTAPELREFLSARLPDYMIPARYVALDAFPINANGKLDRTALPAPTAANLLPGGDVATSAESELEQRSEGCQQQLASMVASLLGHPSVQHGDNFFMLGGHSMLGVQLVAKIRDTFGVKLTLRQLFAAPTVTALAAEVSRLKPGAAR